MLTPRRIAIPVLWAVAWLPSTVAAQETTGPDTAARSYVNRCTGCHTIGKGALTGPDLVKSLTWPDADLRTAIARMQEKTGPITPVELDALIALLKDDRRDARIAAEQERIAAQFAVQMDPPSADVGRALYLGTRAFENGGTACVACHHFSAISGGALGPDLTGIHARMGTPALISATEAPAFKVMGPLYRARPVTRQESLHVARFLETEDRGPANRPAPPWMPASALVVAALGGVLLFARKHAPRPPAHNARSRS
ncbi:MAG: c-type cytochrome [Planctomycetes bacterium]|nr:c-type cytochrome [Planctomycetota bacterium]